MPPVLQTSSNTGSQTNAQSPQTATQSGTGGSSVKAVQPGAATASLNQSSASGVSVTGTATAGIDLNSITTASKQVVKAPEPATRDFNPALIAIPVVLLLVGIVLVWAMHRSVKNTTQYK